MTKQFFINILPSGVFFTPQVFIVPNLFTCVDILKKKILPDSLTNKKFSLTNKFATVG